MSGAPWAAVLFDLDGTLADTIELILLSYRHTMETHLGEAPPDEAFLATIGTPLERQLAQFARDEREIAAMRRTYRDFQREIHDGMVRPYAGARDVLERLREQGTRIGVVTSKASTMAGRTLECCGLRDLVEVIVCADQVERPKPHPESVLRALEDLGVDGRPDDTLFVGDSPFDMRAGRDAGVRTGAALWGPFGRAALEAESPDYYFAEPAAVLTGPGG